MIAFILRFLGAGLVVGALPWVADRFGEKVAGLVLLLPVVTIAGFIVLTIERGSAAVAQASLSSITALPVVFVFLLAVHLAARQGLGIIWTLSIGASVWLIAATMFVALVATIGGLQ